MIHGHKPNGWVTTFSGDMKKQEGETRQCIHCQKVWTYVPGSGTTRGYCLNCDGFLCAERPCFVQQQEWIEQWLELTGKVRSCIPFHEWNARRIDKLAHKFPLEPGMTVSSSGLIVPVSLAINGD